VRWPQSRAGLFGTLDARNGTQLKDVQKAASHRDPGTTKLHDRRGYNPETVSFRPTGCFGLTA
jgi:hypothetical protein